MKRLILCLSLLLLFVFTSNVSATSDGTPPVVENVEILTKEVAPGGKIKIKVTASDDVSGIKFIAFMFKSPSDNAIFQPLLYLDSNSPLEGTYTFESESLNAYAEIGDWKLVLVRTEDFAGNSISYHTTQKENAFLQNIKFTVDPNVSKDEVAIDDGFKALEPKLDVDTNKEFTIKFSMNLNIKTLTEGNIYILDQNGNRVPLMFIIDRKENGNTSEIIIAPLNRYRSQTSYTLYVKDIYSVNGQKLSQNTKMKFTTK